MKLDVLGLDMARFKGRYPKGYSFNVIWYVCCSPQRKIGIIPSKTYGISHPTWGMDQMEISNDLDPTIL